ncbi:DUF3952 domain-containing protein [Bacillus thuringiensis]|uniref:DUF3952 domain-containing protein n=2 Tax=Bacillaceae TaxID=186817 RepID=A0A9W3TD22_BACTU|nr:hypothetical protein B4918_11960 [Bacillus thuringiensis]RHW05798.1 hypothetical protein B7P27_26605 [Bacillus cereus]PEC94055.1 DUF3952 domain-containing protein [Bacillus thuringiensis]PER88508.1 DUF3952 domain-containing protein [Bacillus thuringiensis]PFO19251.1 DUF3952 domain-containing protein [Bacillus thuringiensis]
MNKGVSMKLKKKAKMIIVLSIVANLLSGCGFGETKIEYERLVKALDEGDMKTVMSASDEGYVYVKEEVRDSTFIEDNNKQIGVVYQTTQGIYSIKDNILFGEAQKKVNTPVEDEKHSDNPQYKEEVVFKSDIRYENGQLEASNRGKDMSNIKLMLNRVQGIKELKPNVNKKSFSQPATISYNLSEIQFKEIFNGNLELKYEKFSYATLLIEFNSAKDTKENPMEITEITISIGYKQRNEENNMIRHDQEITTYLRNKEENNRKSKKDYLQYEKKFKESH